MLSGFSEINDYLPLAGGIALVLILVTVPDGLFEMNQRAVVQLFAPLISHLNPRRIPRRKAVVTLTPFSLGVSTSTHALPLVCLMCQCLSEGSMPVRGVSLDVSSW